MATITAAAAPEAVPTGWAAEDKRRMLHVVYRVGDLQKHIDFYTNVFGMHLTRKRDVPEGGHCQRAALPGHLLWY